MFALVESSRSLQFAEGWAGRAGSFALHAMALSLAVALTRHAGRTPPPEPIRVVDLRWSAPRPLAGRTAARAVVVRTRPVFQLPTTPPTPSPNVPAVVLPGPEPFVSPGPAPDSGAAATGDSGGPVTAPPVDVGGVDQLPVLVSHPPIRYPELLRQAGIQGSALVEAVLDTLGRVEPGSVRILHSDADQFGAEARAVVTLSRYRPARIAGRAVRVRIQVPVGFTIRR